ncbi:hypothetical protein N7454_002892 [Penicillium verhagenii]|nr:hypothetical protein N7454_002892 [Penicillium verhagenii]
MASPNNNQSYGGLSEQQLDRILERVLTRPDLQSRMRGALGPAGPHGTIHTTTSAQWKPADIGFFDPSIKDPGGLTFVNEIVHYTSVYAFVDRMRYVASLKPEKVSRAQMHSCLKNDALSWYTQLPEIEKRLL